MKSTKMSKFVWVQSIVLLILVLAGAVMAQAPTYRPVATVLQIMQGIVVPNSDVVFKAPNNVPKNDKDWAVVQNSALTLAEVGNLLMMPGRASVYKQQIDADIKNGGDWAKDTKALSEMSMKAFDAANAKDIKELEMVTDDLELTCENCHGTYHLQK